MLEVDRVTTTFELAGRAHIPISDGWALPERFAVQCSFVDSPFECLVEVGVRPGQAEALSVRVGDHPTEEGVTTDLLRQVPVTRIVALGCVQQAAYSEDGGRTITKRAVPRPPRITQDGPTEPALRATAMFYRVAAAAGVGPTSFVAEQLELNRRTAADWVRRAREAAILGAALPRRAGEADR